MRTVQTSALAGCLALAFLFAFTGCQNRAQTGMLAGAGVGALMGQVIGASTGATLIGAGVGLGIGYIIGNEMDKSETERRHAAQLAQAQTVRDSLAPVTHDEVGALGGTRWRVVNVHPNDAVPPRVSMIVEFRPNGRVITTRTAPDGTVTVADESYRVVGRTLIVNAPNYLINAQFQQTDHELILSAERFSAVLERLPG